jgi:pimeloyl-ACP methyl ester carboxylesterase
MTALAETVSLAGGGRASCEVVGSGEPLLYFQGGPGFSASLLRDEAAQLADRFAVYLIDPPGSGGSTPPADPSGYDHVGHARFYDRARQALGIERATIMGISFGAIVALTYAALFPDPSTRCIAIAGRVVGEDEQGEAAADEMERMLDRHAGAPWYPSARATWDAWTERVLAATDSSEVDHMMAEVLPLYTADPERPGVKRAIEAWRTEARCNLAAAKAWEGGLWQTIDARPLLPRIRCPTLLLVGELDLICGPAHAGPILEAIPDVRLVSVPDCGHFVPIESPELFREAVLSFAAQT